MASARAHIRSQEPARPIPADPYVPWGFVGYINMLRYFDPVGIPQTRGGIAAERVRQSPEFCTLPQAERDRRVMAAMEAA